MTARAVLTAAIVAAGLTVTASPAVAQTRGQDAYGVHHTAPMAVPVWMTHPCPEEDSTDCYWHAQTRGNGHGASFYAARVRLLGVDGRRLGVVSCHFLVPRAADRRFTSCQVTHRRTR